MIDCLLPSLVDFAAFHFSLIWSRPFSPPPPPLWRGKLIPTLHCSFFTTVSAVNKFFSVFGIWEFLFGVVTLYSGLLFGGGGLHAELMMAIRS